MERENEKMRDRLKNFPFASWNILQNPVLTCVYPVSHRWNLPFTGKSDRKQSTRLRVKGIDALWSQAYSLLQACIIASLSLPNPISPPDTQGYLLITNPPKVWLLGNPICVPFNSFPITYWKFSLNQHILQINWFFKNHWSSPILQNGDLIQYKNPTATNS